MFSKIWASCVLVSVLCLEVTAHAIVSPALGVQGTPVKADVQQPNNASPCGPNIKDIASAIDSATVVSADAHGSFHFTATSFNGGDDGSRQFTATVDESGTGKNFVPMTITENGDTKSAAAGSQPIVALLPKGTKCTGGKAGTGNICLVQLISKAGFGNCVAVSQSSADAGTPTATVNGGKSATTPAASHCHASAKMLLQLKVQMALLLMLVVLWHAH